MLWYQFLTFHKQQKKLSQFFHKKSLTVYNKSLSFPRWSHLLKKEIQSTIAPFVETIGAQATRCRCPNRERPSTTRIRTQAQNRLCIRRASRDDCSVPGVALSASPSILEPRKWGSNPSEDFVPRNRARRESSAKGWTWNSRRKRKKQSSFFGVLTLFRQLRCYNGRDVFKKKKKIYSLKLVVDRDWI